MSAFPDEALDNGCEHGDHPAPPGKRFCSAACAACENAPCEEGCSGICMQPGDDYRRLADGKKTRVARVEGGQVVWQDGTTNALQDVDNLWERIPT